MLSKKLYVNVVKFIGIVEILKGSCAVGVGFFIVGFSNVIWWLVPIGILKLIIGIGLIRFNAQARIGYCLMMCLFLSALFDDILLFANTNINILIITFGLFVGCLFVFFLMIPRVRLLFYQK